ncbi:MAG: hypothetical protein Q8P05_02955 [Candidatus Diapherotrites archaeon]|nr:hypothetical protein [Candidatus Diapherotrites archaeon]
MFKRRGQGTTEYLIILAIVIVIALVVVSVLGGIPSIGTSVNENTSRSYWGSVSPLAVTEWISAPTAGGSLVMKNLTSQTITLTQVHWGGTTINVTDVVFGPGGTQTVQNDAFDCGTTSGQQYNLTLGYEYDSPNLTGVDVNGSQSIVGTCQ